MKKEFPKGTVILFLSFIVLVAIAYISSSPKKNKIPQELMAVLRPHAIPLQPFTLIDKDKQLFTTQQLKGKWNFVFFGYTYCPDICPTTLSTLKQINNMLKKKNIDTSEMQVIFVSIDPDRDKPEMLAKYVEYFNKDFIAVTGDAKNLQNFSRQFAVAYIKEKADKTGDYLISHTSSIFLVDPKMRIVASFAPPHNAETITSQYLKIHDIF